MSAANSNHPWRDGFSPKAPSRRRPAAARLIGQLDDEALKKINAELDEGDATHSYRVLQDVYGARDPSFMHVSDGAGRRTPVRYD